MIFLRYYENIILDKNIESLDLLFNSKFGKIDFYAICVSKIGNGLMEIISVRNMLKTINQYKDYGIIAVIKGSDNAKELSAKLIQDWLKKNNNLDGFKDYYNNKCR